MNNRLVIIGANDFQNQLILKAKSLGYETFAFAWADGAVGAKTADHFYDISITEKEQILEKCKEINPCGVCTIASDLAAITVSYVADNLGLPCNNYSDIPFQTNKYLMRSRLCESGVTCPVFHKVSETDGLCILSDMKYPIIVKPTDRSGSRSITKLYDENGLSKAIHEACIVSFEKRAIVEEYIEGNEYSCECISYNGQHKFLTFTKKYTTGSPNYIETGHLQPSDIPQQYQKKIINEIFKALTALNVKYGASHTEFKVDADGNMKIIEIGARMGGDCIGSDLVMLSTGYDFMKMVIDCAVGNTLDMAVSKHYDSVEIKFLFNTDDIEAMNKYVKENKDSVYRISDIEIENLGKTVDSSSRLGYYIVVK